MARNRIIGRETQKMQEYTQEQINQAESRGIEISTDVKEQLFEYANLIGEKEKVRALVRNLADAVSQADSEGVEDLLDDARMDIQELPDPTIGKLELRDYGYMEEDMVPLRKEAALDYHRMGSKIYRLGSAGSKGEYASKEMIQAHDGLFGMESQMWERIKDNNLDHAEENLGAFQEPMSVIEQEEALKLYDAGADIYFKELGNESPVLVKLIMKTIYQNDKREFKHIGAKQFDNEYGGEGSYLMALKHIAQEIGFELPFYTRTGWPELKTPIPYGEMIPLYGDYADGF